ncbi:GDYXXLXY domain-containing protein [Paenibacillus sp. CGMCC 1.16610]|uniref:DUF2157 domain-containing protein n=1 Tax=Paenibacillus anseongense TaxID=2682845 RepID=A0ABW9UAZ5_9BACL|nr:MULTISPECIES: GDYXXLXY domain-containing protein [Paenibacillus]MBA2942090.1 GDYXXLXY domain-containing protein [Paenibacillus sp. CGMCC 1.16610]MVQ35923.1 DUF2157 domain-containing protein [Paenibacillus anseongense]
MKSKWITIQLGYVLGASSLLTAIVYFFATNWEQLNRWEKFAPTFLLILGFYGLSVWLSHQTGRQFLSRLSLFASCVSFGVGAGLIGQTYNSHADSYTLFAVWFIPAFLFAIWTRWQPFYILSYILGHLAYCFYFFPHWQGGSDSEGVRITIWVGLAIVNGIIYLLTERGKLNSSFLKWISFQAVIGILLVLSNSYAFEDYGVFMNLPLIGALAAAVWYSHKMRSKAYLLFSGLWISATITFKYIELVVRHYNELFFIISLLFVIVFIGANVKFMTFIRAWQPAEKPRNEVLDGEAGEDVKPEGDFTKWIVRVLTVSVVIIGSLLGSLTVIGIVTLVLGFENPENVLMGFGLVVVTSMIFLKKLNALVRYTILISGLLLGAGAAVFAENIPVQFAFLALTIAAFIYIAGMVHRIFFFLAAILITAAILTNWLNSSVVILSVITGLLFVLFAGGQVIRNAAVRQPVLYSSYPSFLFTLFVLTFMTESAWYYVTNALFFILVVLALVVSRQLHSRWIFAWSMGFWTAFLVYKYYDLAWKLLHKSITFGMIGILILIFTVWYEKRHRLEAAEPETAAGANVKANRLLIAVLVLLQIAAMSIQIGKSEWLLSHGQLIKLQLEPLDPRSLIQGDYVRLRYTISEPPISDMKNDDVTSKKKISVVLAPNTATDVYEFKRVYTKGEELAPGEVRMNGTRRGYEGIDYGIENYFIPEGTGRTYEQNAKFAEVKVSAGGDAILERLILQQSVVQ